MAIEERILIDVDGNVGCVLFPCWDFFAFFEKVRVLGPRFVKKLGVKRLAALLYS